MAAEIAVTAGIGKLASGTSAVKTGSKVVPKVGSTKVSGGKVLQFKGSATKLAESKIQLPKGGSTKVVDDIVGTNHNAIKPTQDIVNPQKVADYVKRLQAGEKLKSVKAVNISGKGIYITNGHHRYVASQRAGIPVDIKIVKGQGPVGMPNWNDVQWKEYISESQFWGN